MSEPRLKESKKHFEFLRSSSQTIFGSPDEHDSRFQESSLRKNQISVAPRKRNVNGDKFNIHRYVFLGPKILKTEFCSNPCLSAIVNSRWVEKAASISASLYLRLFGMKASRFASPPHRHWPDRGCEEAICGTAWRPFGTAAADERAGGRCRSVMSHGIKGAAAPPGMTGCVLDQRYLLEECCSDRAVSREDQGVDHLPNTLLRFIFPRYLQNFTLFY
ncbi:hypothetical protein J6590_074868 [Homalodisca vitripennis]|nr:hypothetical protein J6590_074868 [Homalodisca vitripennis]